MGIVCGVDICTDASAAIGVASRRGLGKTKNVEINLLWLQEKVRNGDISLKKVSTGEKLADALTKPVDGASLARHVGRVGLRIKEWRHELMPEVAEEDFGEDEGIEYEEVGKQHEDWENCLGWIGV
jgi:hypothetical protein